MGVNCIKMNQGTSQEVDVQLGELVRRPEAVSYTHLQKGNGDKAAYKD